MTCIWKNLECTYDATLNLLIVRTSNDNNNNSDGNKIWRCTYSFAVIELQTNKNEREKLYIITQQICDKLLPFLRFLHLRILNVIKLYGGILRRPSVD